MLKAKSTIIAWTPNTGNQIEVGGFISSDEGDWTFGHSRTGGAADVDRRGGLPDYIDADDAYHAMALYRDFVTLVIRDGMNPKAVYDQFIKIDEFEKFLPEDLPGVKL